MFKNLFGTSKQFFRIGKTGPRLKDSSGILELRTFDDSAYQIGRCANPIAANDIVNLGFLNANARDRVIFEFVINGALPNAPQTAIDGYRIAPFNGVVENVFMALQQRGTATNSPTIIDLNLATPAFTQGSAVFNFSFTTMYTTQANRPSIAGNSGSSTQKGFVQGLLPDITAFSQGNLLSVDLDQRSNSSDDLIVIVVLRKT